MNSLINLNEAISNVLDKNLANSNDNYATRLNKLVAIIEASPKEDTERLKYLYSYNIKKEQIIEHSYEQWIANIDILRELDNK